MTRLLRGQLGDDVGENLSSGVEVTGVEQDQHGKETICYIATPKLSISAVNEHRPPIRSDRNGFDYARIGTKLTLTDAN